MIWIINFLIIIFFIEVTHHLSLKVKIFKIINLSKKIFNHISNKNLGVDEKKKIIEDNIKKLIKLYIKIVFIFSLVVLFFLIINKLFHLDYNFVLLNFIEVKFLIASVIFIFLYLKVKNKILKQSRYSYLSKIFHKFVLNSNQRLKVLFEIEKFFFLKKNDEANIDCLFITGLPRSGSTILLKSLYNTHLFSSLKYSDMPFITSPNLWSKINFLKKKILIHERAHQDGINIDLDSPEAFEEIFWRSQLDNNNEQKLYYNNSQYKDNIIDEFQSFIKLIVLNDKKNFYLSKNNNNIIRIKFLLDKLKKKKNYYSI